MTAISPYRSRGVCPTCGQRQRVHDDGRIAPHDFTLAGPGAPDFLAAAKTWSVLRQWDVCPGAGYLPREPRRG